VTQELLDRGTPGESVEALDRLIASLERRRERVARKADVLEAAHALLLDAYDEFRDRDQDRLVDRVSGQVRRLSGGRLESVHVDGGTLEEARVRTHDRLLPMASPPLSFGEFHALQLGIRLGAAEFLAGLGILPPVVIDEPFAQLDPDRAASVWALLTQLATERQVVVTTHDDALLTALGIEPDIRLG
jgi:DNA repair exonuclease SbcCD ATPase subunit